MIRVLTLILLAACLSSCVTASKLNSIHLGMSRDGVIQKLGSPNSVYAESDTEILEYLFMPRAYSGLLNKEQYWVMIRDNKVIKYGHYRSFPNTNDGQIQFETNNILQVENNTLNQFGEPYTP